ncbi:MAG: hypothetical protein HS119_14010, partial [Flavobacteriales bacterium]|nr:hypothetical protein [Flavobacteriales bacterium]
RTCKKEHDKAFDIICQIIKNEKLKLSPCPNNFNNKKNIKLESPMICFTETPLDHSLNHCKDFGKFGIGFDKQDMINIGANPVLYIVKERKHYQDELINFYNYLKRETDNIPFDIRNKISWFLASTQPHTDDIKNITREYYSQREWRIIRILPFGITDNEIKKWGSINDIFDINEINVEYEERIINGTTKSILIGWLKFKKSSIRNIIVPKKYKDKALKLREEEELVNCDVFLI